MLKLLLCVWLCVCGCVWVHVFCVRFRTNSTVCDAVPAISSLLIYGSRIVLPELTTQLSLAHQWARPAWVRLKRVPPWLQDLTEPGPQRRWGTGRRQRLASFSDWVTLDRPVSTLHKELKKILMGGGEEPFNVYCTSVCKGGGGLQHVTHSNHLNYFL